MVLRGMDVGCAREWRSVWDGGIASRSEGLNRGGRATLVSVSGEGKNYGGKREREGGRVKGR